MDQKTLADKAGVNIRTISLYENAKNYPKVDLLMQLAEVLRTPIEHFFVDDPEEIGQQPVPDMRFPILDDNKIFEKVKEHRGALSAFKQLMADGDPSVGNKLIDHYDQIIDETERAGIYIKQLEANLSYSSELLHRLTR